MIERFTVDSDGKWWDKIRHEYVTLDSLFRTVEELDEENRQLKQENKGIQDKVWKLLELLEKEYGIDKRKIIDWWNGDVVENE